MRPSCLQSPLRTLAFTALLYLFSPAPAHAQSPFLYASISTTGATSQVAGYSVASDGTLTGIAGSPFSVTGEGGLITTDPTDQLLFVLNPKSNTISVLAINPTTGALAEITGSPVLAPTAVPGSGGAAPYNPICMATYKGESANYLFVAYRNTTPTATAFNGAIVAFQIGTTGPPLTPAVQTNFEATPVNIVTRPAGSGPQGYLYAVLQSAPGDFSGIAVFNIDPSGALNRETSLGATHINEQTVAIHPKGTLLFDGWGTAFGGIESSALLPDGSLPPLPTNSVSLNGSNSPPTAMLVDGSGQLLFVQQDNQAAAYLIDQSSGALTATASAPPFTIKIGLAVANPVEPFIYTLQSGQIGVSLISDFQVGTVVGLKSYPIPSGSGGLAITHNADQQNLDAHAAKLWPPTIPFLNTTVNQPSNGPNATLTNIGTDPLNISSIAIVGADANNFSTQPNCPSQLAPQATCSISVTFTPLQSGALQAALIVTDDADSTPQSIQLIGSGVGSSSGSGGSGSGGSGSGGSGSGSGGSGGSGSGGGGSGSGGSGGSGGQTQPTIAISPAALSFAAPELNVATPPQYLTLTNSGSTPLQISSVQIMGTNSADFAYLAACPKLTYTASQACSLQIIFTPSAPGTRSATLQVNDDAPDSPQVINLVGSSQAETLTILPQNGGSLVQIVTAGQTATFKLQLIATFAGTVSFAPCSHAPAKATCSTDNTSLSFTANQPTNFSVNIATVAGSSSPTPFGKRNAPHISPKKILLFALLIAYVLLVKFFSRSTTSSERPSSALHLIPRPHAFSPNAAIIALLSLTLLTIAGCGGASTVATAPVVTPTPTSASQTYTISITPTSTNTAIPTIPPIQLTLIVN